MGYEDMIERAEYKRWSNEELLQQYKRTKNHKIKQELVERYLYIIQSIAIQMRDVYVGFAQLDDIIHEGVMMLMGAIDKFEFDRNAKFETYVSKRIRGMIIDIARKQDWIPRTVRKNIKDIEQNIQILTHKLGRTPEPKEVANFMGVSEEKYQLMLSKMNLFYVLSLDKVLDESGEAPKILQIPSMDDAIQPEKSYLNKEFRQLLVEAIKHLKEKEQKVIALYYIEELNMKEIAYVLQVSEARVSQIHGMAIKKLREYIENNK